MWKQLSQLHWSWVLLHLVCSLAVSIQVVLVLQEFVNPQTTNSEIKETHLQDLDFPLLFKICVDPSFNDTAVEALGYDSIWNYFSGMSRFNASIYGWAGHTNRSGVKDSVSGVFDKVKSSVMAPGLLTRYKVASGPGVWSNFSSDQLYQRHPNYPHNCYTLDIPNHTRGKPIETLYFYFESPDEKTTVQVLVPGKEIETSRDVYDNMFLSSGDAIETQPGKLTKYALEINQKVFVEEDKSKKCRNYPNEDFDSYAACDEKFMKSVCEAAKLSPIWLEEDINKVTEQTSVNIKGKMKIIFDNYFFLFQAPHLILKIHKT